MKLNNVLWIFFVCILQSGYSQIGRLALSPYQESSIKIGTTDISLSYSRPSMRDRQIFGGLVPYNQWWRTGANRNTKIKFSEDVIIGNTRVSKGEYAIFSKPTPDQWEIIFYKKTDNWDVPEDIEQESIAASIVVPSEKRSSPLEVLSIVVGDFTNYTFDLNIGWEETTVKIPIQLTTREIMEKKLTRTLDGPSPSDYYLAALYEMESGKNFTRGLTWIEETMRRRESPMWWDYRVKAILLMELDRKKEALPLVKKALEIATAENHEYGKTEMKRILKLLEE